MIKYLFFTKIFKFKNFIESQNFNNEVGKIAEQEGHHPDITMVGVIPKLS